MLETSTRSAIFCTPHSDGMYSASSKSSGGRLQEILAKVVAQQSENEVGVKPTSRSGFGPRWQPVDMQQGFQALEREFDLPAQSVHGEYIFCRVAVYRQRRPNDHE